MDVQSKGQPLKDPESPSDPVPKNPRGKSFRLSWFQIGGILGVLVLLIAGGIWVVFRFPQGMHFFSPSGAQRGAGFYQGLAEFDELLTQNPDLDKPDVPLRLNRALDALGKKSFGLESSLSLLKRRRFLAYKDPRFLEPYQKAVHHVLEAFPFSEPIVALAAEELLFRDAPITEESTMRLTDYASRIAETELKPVALNLYILAGTFQDPLKAAAIPQIVSLFSVPLPVLPGERTRTYEELQVALAKDETLIRILQGDISGATIRIQELLQEAKTPDLTSELVQYAGAFFYDYGNPLRAAELFSQYSDEKSMSRQADALWLAGHRSGAQNLWTVLVSPNQAGTDVSDTAPEIKIASLYNLATTAQTSEEGIGYLDRLVAEAPDSHTVRVYGILRYTRLLDTPQSIRILEKEQGRNQPLIDLELLRRRRTGVSLDQTIAETWLLLNRYPTDERLYRWGAYFFDYQRRYTETAFLIKNARSYQVQGSWIPIHDSLHLLMEGHLEEAEERLTSILSENPIWQVPANMGLILEARRAPAAALEYYQRAAASVTETEAAAQVQFRIGHCLRILGRDRESRQAFERALELNPHYLNARLELQRLDTIF
ncbi:MAG: tetratricopeptide repeat protein [Treponema sp.]|jgi:tetratricopeptide (TPR) repeat protein|nr:tetratricopeptide repeat protein [Treponema sp.]